MDCSGTLGLDSQHATQAALVQNYYFPVGTKEAHEKQPLSFKWSIVYFVFSGATFLACKFFWKMLESNHLTYLSSKCRDSLSDPDKRDQMATDIVCYINKCERGQYLMVKYIFANLISLGAMVGLLLWYLDSVDYFNHPFSVSEFNMWKFTTIEERTDIMIKLFPRKLVFPYQSSGSSGTLEGSGILCNAVINTVLEQLYAAALLVLTIVTSLQIFSMLLSLLSISFFHITTKRNNQRINGVRNLTYGQRLILALLYKNIDYHLWCAILDRIANTSNIFKEDV